MPALVLGPLLRHVDATSATVWVETDRPCQVEVRAGGRSARRPTFQLHGHHYALVDVRGLAPATCTPYTVDLDGEQVWPPAGTRHPASVVQTYDEHRPLRLSFGSCRTSVAHDATENRKHGVDVLRALARRMATQDPLEWPDALLLLGDQVYADEPSTEMSAIARSRRDISQPPGEELADFEEYTHLYRFAWSDPDLRWLLSTLPSAMIFDDHDVRDDWNTSAAWRADMAATPWWRRRIIGALASYWVYQHLGNLSPAERAADATYAAVLTAEGDAGGVLDAMAWDADQHPGRHRWSYARDYGGVRLVVVDSRCGRVLTPRARTVLDAPDWEWLAGVLTGGVDHLLVATSLPVLLPLGIHHVEGWNEAVCDGVWGRRFARYGERVRQALDLEHWAAFRRSFDALAGLVADVAAGRRGTPPATVTFLSGDVHYSYLARASLPGAVSLVQQAVCSPIRNPLPRLVRYANGVAAVSVARAVGRLLARAAGVRDPDLTWRVTDGPWYPNALATVTLDRRRARLRWDTGTTHGDDVTVELLAEVDLG